MNVHDAAVATVEFGRFTVIPHRRALLLDGRAIKLGERAFDVLLVLLAANGTVLSKDELIQRAWRGRIVAENSLEVQISALRRALGVDRKLIRTVHGRGYQFVGSVHIATEAQAITRKTNLPEEISALIGREHALGELTQLIETHRLVTLTGPAGIGKTSLALGTARRMLDRFPDGVWLANFGPLRDPRLVPITVARAIGLKIVNDSMSTEAIASSLANRRVLLIVDNCEHVLDAVADMVRPLLRVSPAAQILATSREPLREQGEHLYRVPPLAVPKTDHDTPEAAFVHGAVALFVARIQALEPRYITERSHLPDILAICRRLDGLPLALELAAARVPAFGIAGVYARLNDRFKLLIDGHRSASRHHSTLRAALDWSYELLTRPEQVVLRRLAVFTGSFGLESALAVVADETLPDQATIDCVAQLVAKSLLSTDLRGTDIRYRLLETTRVYAREKLVEFSELTEQSRCHAQHFRDLFSAAETHWAHEPSDEWVSAQCLHLDNLRSALDWCFGAEGDARIGITLMSASVPLWFELSLMNELRARAETALAFVDAAIGIDPAYEMKLHAARGAALIRTYGVGARIGEAMTRTLQLADQLDDDEYRLRALWGLWAFNTRAGAHRSALDFAGRFGQIAARSDDPENQYIGDRILSFSHHCLGDHHRARRLLAQQHTHIPLGSARYDLVRFIYDQHAVADSVLAHIQWLQGLPIQGMKTAQEAVAGARCADHAPSLCYALIHYALALALYTRETELLENTAAELLTESERQLIDRWNALGHDLRALARLRRGERYALDRVIRPILARSDCTFLALHYVIFFTAVAGELLVRGEIDDAWATVTRAINRSDQSEDRRAIAELLRITGELILVRGGPDACAIAENTFREALNWAQRQGALFWELRCSTSLARLWHHQDKTREGHALLTAVYNRFTEGFATADLIAAKALIDQLAAEL